MWEFDILDVEKRNVIISLLLMVIISFCLSAIYQSYHYENKSPINYCYKLFGKIGFGCQYGLDTPNIIKSSAWFPAYYNLSNVLINRPFYCSSGFVIGRTIYNSLSYFYSLKPMPVTRRGMGFY